MNSEQLKVVQTPLKERYRSEPDTALVTIRSSGRVDIQNQHCRIQSHSGEIRAGLHPAAGGSADDACSAELLLESLIACAGVTLSAVATNMGIEVRSCTIRAEADMDFRGTLGVDRAVPVGLTAIRMNFDIDTAAEETVVAKLIQLTERYCVIYQTLLKGVPNITVS